MKSLYLILAFLPCLFALSGFGQSALDKGNYQLGGSFEFSYSKSVYGSYSDKAISFDLRPEFTYFVIDNLLVGGTLSYQHRKYIYDETDEGTFISNSLGIGPSCRYYFRTKTIIPFIGSSFVFNKYLDSEEYGFDWDVSAGFDIFIARSLAIEPYISYSIGKEYSPASSGRDLSTGIRLSYYIIK